MESSYQLPGIILKLRPILFIEGITIINMAMFRIEAKFDTFSVIATTLIALTALDAAPGRADKQSTLIAQSVQQRTVNERHKQAGKRAIADHDMQRALSEFRTFVQNDPASPDGHFWLGYCLAELGQNNEALTEYAEAERQEVGYGADFNLDSVELRINRGNALKRAGQNQDAKNEYQRALAIDPLADDARLDLVQLLLLEGRLDDAFHELGECAQRRGNDPKFCLLEGIANLRRGQTQSAAEWLHKCQVTSNQSQPSSRSDAQIANEAQNLLRLMNIPGS